MNFKTPILFLTFNRLNTTQAVLDSIRTVQPSRLYLASDGYRSNRKGEDELVESVRNYVSNHIDWKCEIKTLFRKKNLGCGVAVRSAIDWFFEHESEGIILEDDCVPDKSFFYFCQDLLLHYKNDERVMAINGMNVGKSDLDSKHSYSFSRYSLPWGWATWRRAWHYNNDVIKDWPAIKETNFLLNVGHGNRAFQDYWTNRFDEAYGNGNHTWDHQWILSCWWQNGLCVSPNVNLVQNIGYGEDATHTNREGMLHTLEKDTIDFPLQHPDYLHSNFEADKFIDRNLFKINGYTFLRSRLKKIISR
ncbi:MAG: nucleotide-diphospho-sugar transferase [Cyanobacteria bacterium P01_F01_bin.150]